MLAALSTVYPEIPRITPDGIFGPQTQEAVLAAQQVFGLSQTGAVGTPTWEEIASQYMTVVNGSRVADGQYPGQPLVAGGQGGGAA